MRRLIAHIALASTILVAVGVAATPVFTSMTPGREFTSGNEIVYRLSDRENSNTDLANDSDAASVVASEMRSRLDTYQIEDYSVRVDGNDTIRVSVSTTNTTQLQYISRYLSFSGENFSLAGKEEETRITHDKIFEDSTAYIYRQDDIVPYVIIPVSDVAAVKTLVETVSGGEEEPELESAPRRDADSGEEESSATPDIFLWANWVEGETYEIAEKDASITGQKILCQFVSSNIWFNEELKDDEEPTALKYLCGYSNSEGSYDTDKLKEANDLATFVVNMLNASSYEYEVENLFVSQSASGVTNNEIRVSAAAESLLVYGTNVSLAWSATLISTLVLIVVASLILALFYRLGALGIAANSIATTFLTFMLFIALGATFNVASIVGGVLVAISSLAIGVLYMNKLKEEVYKGRSLRKANQEAMKKIVLPSIDIAVVSAFAGLMLYFIAGNALRPLGIMLFFGGIISLVMNMLIFRVMMWLLTNSASMQENYKLLNMDANLVPNVMKEEKPTYVAPYETTDFSKRKKPFGIIFAILAVASIGLITTFGIIKGSPLNLSASTSETTEVYLSIRSDNPALDTENEFKEEVLSSIVVNDSVITYESVTVTSRDEYDYESDITTHYTYFLTTINQTFAESDKYSVVVKDSDGNVLSEDAADTLDDAFALRVAQIEGESSEDYIVSEAKVSVETVDTPNQGFVALATAIAIVGAAIYFAFRYRPSRGIAALIVSSLASLITYGVFVACRIEVSAICSLIIPIAAIISLIGCLFYFEKEKELLKEQKEELTPELRGDISKKATSFAATPLFITLVIAAYMSINYFAFGSIKFAAIFAGAILAIVLTILLVLYLLGPISLFFSKLFKKIKLPTIKIERHKKSRIKLQGKPKTSEPEETVFIGIND